ncbi:ABC transporter substrate-binding protein [Eubacteriales bacterium OttesenSCG-928-A19]|nr:ABC transporter substrate-binding protein [Eubacteriales bacterium OttesenSCG-928-A19]
MRKLLSVFLAVSLFVGMGSFALAEDVTIKLSHNKVEIDSAIQAFAKAYSDATDGVTVEIETIGGGADYAGSLKAALQSGSLPDIFVIEGPGNYEVWKEYIADLSDQPWVSDTDVAFTLDGKVYGFPVAVEGFGLAYNGEILEKAGIDPATLTNINAVREAFETIDGMKDELGLNAVVSMAASIVGGMTWVTGNHNFSVYLGVGLENNDTSIIDMFNAGEVDADRLAQYTEYVKLLFDYADQDVLLNGNYDSQVASFAEGKTAFLHQGNWVDPNLAQLGVEFPCGYIPHAFMEEDTPGLLLFAPSFYCVNSQSPNAQAAKDFLTYMATTPEGADYMVNQAGMIAAFKSVTEEPAGQLSQALVKAQAAGGNYGVFFGQMPDGFGMNVLGPIFELLGQNVIDEATFASMVADEIAAVPNM